MNYFCSFALRSNFSPMVPKICQTASQIFMQKVMKFYTGTIILDIGQDLSVVIAAADVAVA